MVVLSCHTLTCTVLIPFSVDGLLWFSINNCRNSSSCSSVQPTFLLFLQNIKKNVCHKKSRFNQIHLSLSLSFCKNENLMLTHWHSVRHHIHIQCHWLLERFCRRIIQHTLLDWFLQFRWNSALHTHPNDGFHRDEHHAAPQILVGIFEIVKPIIIKAKKKSLLNEMTISMNFKWSKWINLGKKRTFFPALLAINWFEMFVGVNRYLKQHDRHFAANGNPMQYGNSAFDYTRWQSFPIG